ncbi:polyprenyl synthetase family protein [Tessaracoccus sp. G1721]
MADAPLDEHLSALLDQFEERLVDVAVASSPFVTEASRHIISAGGKRFRPLLVFLASRFGGQVDDEDLMRAALVMELTHVASLYHDDVMDVADLRRGAPSANRLWGNSVAILVGDFLFARASTTVAELGVEYVMLQAETFARLVQGQIAETKGPADGEDPLAHYIQVIADKTGSLIAASALFGGMVAGADRSVLDALAAFGEEVGLVFQLSDDLIDINSTETGKTPGTDLREGVPTLPVLMLRASKDPADAELLAMIDGDLSSDRSLAQLLAALRSHPVMDRAKAEVERRADIARAHLAPLPDGPAKDALLKVCSDLVDRTA